MTDSILESDLRCLAMNDEITIEDVLRIFHIPVEQAGQLRLADAEEYLRIVGYLAKTIK
jgi:hypothetical protein